MAKRFVKTRHITVPVFLIILLTIWTGPWTSIAFVLLWAYRNWEMIQAYIDDTVYDPDEVKRQRKMRKERKKQREKNLKMELEMEKELKREQKRKEKEEKKQRGKWWSARAKYRRDEYRRDEYSEEELGAFR